MELLSKVMEASFFQMSIHAGVTENDVLNKMNEVIELANFVPDQRFILFFDELNTCKLVAGMFKEILMDRHLIGKPLPSNIIPIGAMNPYKLKSEKSLKMEQLLTNGQLKKQAKLQFLVEPIPEAMFLNTLNFDKLTHEEVQAYTIEIIKRTCREAENKCFQFEELKQFSEIVNNCQSHINSIMDSSSACSLRDVMRVGTLFFWLYEFKKKMNDKNIKHMKDFDFCAGISLWLVYLARLPTFAMRRELMNKCETHLNGLKINRLIEEVSTFVTEQCTIPEGKIVKNFALKQNLLGLLICILIKFPIILIGPPGSSKTLSLGIITQSMKGIQSRNEFFKQFENVMPTTYQGHIESDSEKIVEVFKNLDLKYEELKRNDSDKTNGLVMCFEEIGLAELSLHNPLKVLHPILEKPNFSIISVSNWPLDLSKMNRMVSIYRLDSEEQELYETLIGQQEFVCQQMSKRPDIVNKLKKEINLNTIISIYFRYLKSVKEHNPSYSQFHGLRDFYGMIRSYFEDRKKYYYLLNDKNSNKNAVKSVQIAFQRHFCGSEVLLVHLSESFAHVFPQEPANFSNSVSELQMIRENLSEQSQIHFQSRHLMIITSSQQQAIEFVQEYYAKNNTECQLVQGSGFQKDKSLNTSTQIINQIIGCVESGTPIILSNLNSIYQSIYELVNQNYRTNQGNHFCQISLGSENNHVSVSPNFKLIVIIPKDDIPDKIDGPLLNRFEKHVFESNVINESDHSLLGKLNRMVNSIKFPFQFETEVIISLIKHSNRKDQNEIFKQICHLATFQTSIEAATNSQTKHFFEEFINSKYHFSFNSFVQNRIFIRRELKNSRNKRNQECHSASNLFFITSNDSFKQSKYVQFQATLSLISSSDELEDILSKFEKAVKDQAHQIQENTPIIFVLSCHEDKLESLSFAQTKLRERSMKISKWLTSNHKDNYELIQFFSMIITIKISSGFRLPSLTQGWEYFHIEELLPSDYLSCYSKFSKREDEGPVIDLENWIFNRENEFLANIELSPFIREHLSNRSDISSAFQEFIKMVSYSGDHIGSHRLIQISGIFYRQSHPEIIRFIESLVFAQLKQFGVFTINQFLVRYVFQNQSIAQRNAGIMNQVISSIRKLIHNALCFLFLILEENRIILLLHECRNSPEEIEEIFKDILEKIFENNEWQGGEEMKDIPSKFILPRTIKIQEKTELLFLNSSKILEVLNHFENVLSSTKLDVQKHIEEIQSLLIPLFKKCNFNRFLSDVAKLDEIPNDEFTLKLLDSHIQCLKFKQLEQFPLPVLRIIAFKLYFNSIKLVAPFLKKLFDTGLIKFEDISMKNDNPNHIKNPQSIQKDIIEYISKKLIPSALNPHIPVENFSTFKQLFNEFNLFITEFNLADGSKINQEISLWQQVLNLINFSDPMNGKVFQLLEWKSMETLEVSHFKKLQQQLEESDVNPKSFRENWIQFILKVTELIVMNQIARGENLNTLLHKAFMMTSYIEQIAEIENKKSSSILDSQKILIYQILKRIVHRYQSLNHLLEFTNTLDRPSDLYGENISQVILSEIIEECIFKPVFDSNAPIKYTIDYFISGFRQIQELHQIKQAVLLAIFRLICKKSIEQPKMILDLHLKQFFEEELSYPFQFYVIKLFFQEQKQDSGYILSMKNSPIFKDCKWFEVIMEKFGEEIPSTIVNCSGSEWDKILSLIEQSLPKCTNAFNQIYRNNFSDQLYYPFMMLNNISILYENTFDKNSNHLYCCNSCGEYIFSYACPNLPAIPSNKCLRCDKQFTSQENVLQNIQSNLPKLQQLMNTTIRTGFYLNIISETFKLQEGTPLDLRICALVYYYSKLLGIKEQKKLDTSFYKNAEINQNTNRQLRIYLKGDPEIFLNDQIKLIKSHIIFELKSQRFSQSDSFKLLKLIISNLLSDSNIIGYGNPQIRSKANLTISEQIFATIREFKQKALQRSELLKILNEEIELNGGEYGLIFSRSLRRTEALTPNQIEKQLFNQIKELKFQVLQFILSQKDQLELISTFLPGFLTFSQKIHNRFSRKLKIEEVRENSLLDFLDKNKADPLFVYYLQTFIPLWNMYLVKKSSMLIGCEKRKLPQFTENTKLYEMIFCRQEESIGVLQIEMELLCNEQNSFIKKMYSRCSFSSKLKQILTDLLKSTKNHSQFKSKMFITVNPSRNVLHDFDSKIFSYYAMNDVEYSRGKQFIEDFVQLEQEIVLKVVDGAECINLSSERFSFRRDIHTINPLLESEIQQVEAPSQLKQVFLSILTFKEAEEVLSTLSTVFSILKAPSILGETPIQTKLKELQFNLVEVQLEQLFPVQLKLKHTASIIKVLETKWMGKLIDRCNPLFLRELELTKFQKAFNLINSKMKLGDFAQSLGRFIIRTLCLGIPTMNPEGKLFEQLFCSDVSENFWSDSSKLETWYPIFKNDSITISQSYELYQKIIKKIQLAH